MMLAAKMVAGAIAWSMASQVRCLQHQRLQQQAEEADGRGHDSVLVAGQRLLHQHRRTLALPVALDGRLHAHRTDDVGMAQDVFLREHVGLVAGCLRLLQQVARQRLVETRKREQQDGADGRDDAEQRMDEEQQQQIDWNYSRDRFGGGRGAAIPDRARSRTSATPRRLFSRRGDRGELAAVLDEVDQHVVAERLGRREERPAAVDRRELSR